MKNSKITLEQLMQEISDYYYAEINKLELGQITYLNGLASCLNMPTSLDSEQLLRKVLESFEQESYDRAIQLAKHRHFFTSHFWVDAQKGQDFAKSLYISTPREVHSIQQVHVILFSKGKYVAQTVHGRWFDINSVDPSQEFTLGLPFEQISFQKQDDQITALYQGDVIEQSNPSNVQQHSTK